LNEKNIKTAAVVTLGCPMNQVDSESIMSGLVSRGFSLVQECEARVIVVNTCGFLEDACKESIDTILELTDFKASGKLECLIVAGCLAQRYGEDLSRELPEADAVVGLDGRETIPGLCERLLGFSNSVPGFYSRVISGPAHSAYLKIAEGCDNRCTYCTIPSIRGAYRSRPLREVLDDAGRLTELGAKELILIAQDTTFYGKDGGPGLETLLDRLNALPGLEWIRVMYTYPDHYSEAFIEALSSIPKVVPYLDIPVQHISAPVLRRMGRKCGPGRLRRLLDTLRESVPGLVMRTSIIVGFPGETDHDFDELIRFVEDVRFERLGAFIFSPEQGTSAARFPEAVPSGVASARYDQLMEVQAGIARAFHESLVGRQFRMIIDEVDESAREARGRTYMDAPDVDCTVSVAGYSLGPGPFTKVKIVSAGVYDLEACPASDPVKL
jgi:ribosomal protein S12 methylthiotransferase